MNATRLLASITYLFFSNNTDTLVEDYNLTSNTERFYKVGNETSSVLPFVINSKTDVIYFPKCCPPHYIYESEERKCVRVNSSTTIYDDLGFNVSVIRSGLSDCEVIVDRRISELKYDNFKLDRKLFLHNESFSYGEYCLEKLYSNNSYIARLCYPREYCSRHLNDRQDWCLKKCCSEGYVLEGNTCVSRPDLGLNIKDDLDIIRRNGKITLLEIQQQHYSFIDERCASQCFLYANNLHSVALFVDKRPCRTYEAKKSRYNFSIHENGNFWIYERQIWKEYKVEDLMYCMETKFNSTTGRTTSVFNVCTISNASAMKFVFSIPAMVTSSVCLLITIVTYLLVYRLKKKIEIIIVCYCFFLMLFYVLTTLTHIIRDLGKYCEAVGYSVFFSYIASFTWLNILCFDICSIIGSMKTTLISSKHSFFKKLVYYCVYGLAIPSIVTLFLYLVNKQILEVPLSLRPKFITGKCIIRRSLDNYGHILFSVIPVSILIAANVIFFIKTLRYYLKAKNEIKRVTGLSINGKSKKLRFNRQKILMILKLSLVMGVSWIFEIISLSVNLKGKKSLEIIEVIMDTFNYLQGVFVFLIFLVKWQTIKNILSKLNFQKIVMRRKRSEINTTHTECLALS